MTYRGEDLDLRTPHARSAAAGEPGTASGYLNGLRRSDYVEPPRPILVDDIVLEACNYAHEIATAHRAGEVRLEHVVYAFTRIDGAIPALEDRGTRVIALRNDALNMIASAPQTSARTSPRRSDDLEAVLRFAAELAARREPPAATVEDVLIALVELRPDHPGVVLLRRHMPRRVREATYQPLRPEAPPLIRDAERERDHLRPRPTPTEQLVGTTTDSIQNSRIEALEQALRQLSSQLTSERKSLSVSLQDIQRDLGQRRDDELRYGATIGDRVAAVEAGIERRLSDLAHKIESLSLVRADSGPRYDDVVIDRIASIEASIEQRLADLGRAFNSLQDRIQSLDSALAKRTVDASSVKVDITPLQDRIAGVERLLQTSTGETSRGWATVAERIKTLEATLFSEERIGTPAVDLSGLTRQLAAIERNLASGAALKVDLAPLGARLEALEQLILERAAESPADFGPVAARIGALENQLTGEIRRISSVVDQSGEMERRLGQFLGQSLERQRGELVAAIGGSLSERLDASVSAFDPARHLTPVADRLGILERNLTTYVQKVQEQATTYDQDLGEIQDVLIKLHGQQQAMASAAEQWRNEVATEMTAVGTRLSTLERMSQRPAQLMESMNGRIDTLYRLVAEKVERRNRFVYWLFGTNDWLAASWPDRNRTNAPPQA